MKLTKTERKALKKMAGLAYRRELEVALSELGAAFMEWDSGAIDAFQLNDAVHRYHSGPSQELWLRYQSGHPELSVTLALALGILTEADLPDRQLESFIDKARVLKRTMLDDDGSA